MKNSSAGLSEILDRLLKLSISLERFDGEFSSTQPLVAETQSIARALAPYAEPIDLAALEPKLIGLRP